VGKLSTLSIHLRYLGCYITRPTVLGGPEHHLVVFHWPVGPHRVVLGLHPACKRPTAEAEPVRALGLDISRYGVIARLP
jgi:hypothetical protein